MASDIETGDIIELAGLISGLIGAWQDFGYADPPWPGCKPIPPLGERSAEARAAGQEAVETIDRLIRRVGEVRVKLVRQLRQDEEIRAAREDSRD